ncbi:GNAT family N-acetyltransferase [Sutcliffiella horikoshii]|uniref:GNAT family N-acetyltransferase n=1 Tax=Sutcliffiella horikoshii TaxID=79883 RepID=UPI002041AA48|nr:GNAT family N-acetyltransferase [Sutcliffiella horikoshii]MCM3619876.1 GNAT family N-acetyltransferase [Sutcliffiella horikoshii]
MKVLETDRLVLRRLTSEDASFILELLNDPSWIKNIGDKGVRTLEDARRYIAEGPNAMYERFGFCLYLVQLKEEGTPIGLCGLIKRDLLEDVDIGFAFLPRYWSKGYAYEAASAVMEYGRSVLNLKKIVAITAPHNESSAKVLEKIGLKYHKMIAFSNDDDQVRLFN